MTFEMMRDNAQYQARQTITTWDDPVFGKRGVEGGEHRAVVRSKSRTKSSEGGPTYGMDNDDILAELGFGESDIASLYRKGVIKKRE